MGVPIIMEALLLVSLATSFTTTWTGRIDTGPPSLVTWVIDGTNLQCSRPVPNQRPTILEELEKMASPANREPPISNVFVVFDGEEDEAFQQVRLESKWFQYVVTDGKGRQKNRADDYIVHEAIPALMPLGGRIHLVTADKELGKRVVAMGAMKGGSLVHPPKFWIQYLPNLQAKVMANQ
jgi:hypothetical protein